MSNPRSRIPLPGPGRISLAALAVVPAVLAYPWQTARERWVLGVAIVVLVVLLSWWRGLHLTTILRRRAAMLRPHRGDGKNGSPVRTTVLLRVVPSPGDPDMLPLPLIAGYLDRYGLRADTVRITSRDTDAAEHDTWIGLTYCAVDNLAALRARSPRIPLRETAEVAARRLADHLREVGWETTVAGRDDLPELFDAAGREGWHGLSVGTADHVAAYQVSVDDELSKTLADIRSCGARQVWTAVEIAGTDRHRTVAAACALRTQEPPAGAAPLPGLTPQHGNHRLALRALHPLSAQRLDGHTELPADTVAALRWPAGSGRAQPGARHAAVS